MIKHSIFIVTTLFVCSTLFFSCSDDDDDYVGNWIEESDVNGARSEAVCFVINNTVYMGTGINYNDNDDFLNSFYVFDEEKDTWNRIADFPGIPRAGAIAFASSTKGYVGTGYDEDDYRLKDFYEYDPANNTWTQKADFKGSARHGAIAFYVDGKGYVGTGYATKENDTDNKVEGEIVRDFFSYDIDLDQWTAQASVPGKAREYAMSFVINGEAYVLSGLSSGSYLDDFYKYDPEIDNWIELNRISDFDDDHSFDDDYTIARAMGCTFVMDGLAYVTTGQPTINETWEYNPTTDRWDQKTDFEGAGRTGALGFTINGQGYVAAGGSGGYSYQDMYLFHPNEEYENKD